jgi:hypothetical protein
VRESTFRSEPRVSAPPASAPLAERVAVVATSLGIEIALIGAAALAAHGYVRATQDVDFATSVNPFDELTKFEHALSELGLRTRLIMPDDEYPLGGVLRIWELEDDDGDPIEPVEIVNFSNPFRPRLTPGADAVRNAVALDDRPHIRCVRLADLVALKLYSHSRRDLADIVDVLARNPDADLDQVRTICARYGFFEILETLIAEARA